MIFQRNPRLLHDIQRVGCYALTLVEFNARKFEYSFEPEQINNLWETALKTNVIESNKLSDKYRCLNRPDTFANMAKEVAAPEAPCKWLQIGQQKDGVLTYWGWVTDKHKQAEAYVAAMEETGNNGTHWVWVKSIDNPIILYDSWSFTRIGSLSTAKRFVLYICV